MRHTHWRPASTASHTRGVPVRIVAISTATIVSSKKSGACGPSVNCPEEEREGARERGAVRFRSQGDRTTAYAEARPRRHGADDHMHSLRQGKSPLQPVLEPGLVYRRHGRGERWRCSSAGGEPDRAHLAAREAVRLFATNVASRRRTHECSASGRKFAARCAWGAI
eukprot:scaffold76635_cov63-Phaeocystis_antarctica.AAC.2